MKVQRQNYNPMPPNRSAQADVQSPKDPAAQVASTMEDVPKSGEGLLDKGLFDSAFSADQAPKGMATAHKALANSTAYRAGQGGRVYAKSAGQAAQVAKVSQRQNSGAAVVDLTKGVPYLTKTGVIDIGTHQIKIPAEQRVAQKKPHHVTGPFKDPNGTVWNNGINNMYKDILAGKCAKGVKVENGRIKVTDPVLKKRIDQLRKSYQWAVQNQGKKFKNKVSGGTNRIVVNEKTRRAFTSAMLTLLRHGKGKTGEFFVAEAFNNDGRTTNPTQLFFNVTRVHNQKVNQSIQKSKSQWENGVRGNEKKAKNWVLRGLGEIFSSPFGLLRKR